MKSGISLLILTLTLLLAGALVQTAYGQRTGSNLIFKINGVTFTMVYVQGGTFTMGCVGAPFYCSTNEKPTHQVTLSDFYIDQCQVTQQLWSVVMGIGIEAQRKKKDSNWPFYGVGDSYPMYYISYTECEEFVERLNRLLAHKLPMGYRFRLPTEAQWEYAARGGRGSKGYEYSGSDEADEVAWNQTNSGRSTHPVGSKAPNELGLYDMSGNVWEWCYDWYGTYRSSPSTDPRGPGSGSSRVFRGGSWSSGVLFGRVSDRFYASPIARYEDIGMRLSLGQ